MRETLNVNDNNRGQQNDDHPFGIYSIVRYTEEKESEWISNDG